MPFTMLRQMANVGYATIRLHSHALPRSNKTSVRLCATMWAETNACS